MTVQDDRAHFPDLTPKDFENMSDYSTVSSLPKRCKYLRNQRGKWAVLARWARTPAIVEKFNAGLAYEGRAVPIAGTHSFTIYARYVGLDA